jgi:hypothetical protein
MTRHTRDCTEPTRCRSCDADILWVEWASGRRMPVDAVADNRPVGRGGDIVLAHRKDADKLLAEKYEPGKHDAKRNRYTSHFATCPNADEHRRAR